jgi:hypothetical protein
MAVNLQGVAQLVVCQEKNTLVARYSAAADTYAEAVRQLHARIGVCSLEEYRHLKNTVELARKQVDRARILLDLHISSHSCDREARVRGLVRFKTEPPTSQEEDAPESTRNVGCENPIQPGYLL